MSVENLRENLYQRNHNGGDSGETLEIEFITPQIAEKYLSKNLSNRNIRRRAVQSYARDMSGDNFQLSPDCIAFDLNDSLINGQHRLHACLISNKGFWAGVMRGLPQEARIAQDAGVKRSMSDLLKYRGEKNTTNLGATLTWVALYLDGFEAGGASNNLFSHGELLQILDENPSIRNSVEFAGTLYSKVQIPQSIIAGVHYFACLLDEEDANEFWQQVSTGVNLAEGSPALALINWIKNRPTLRNNQYERRQTSAVVITAWNHWRTGREIQRIKWTNSGKRKQDFPSLI